MASNGKLLGLNHYRIYAELLPNSDMNPIHFVHTT